MIDINAIGDSYHCAISRSEEHTSELQSRSDLVCRLLLEKKKSSLAVWVGQLENSDGAGWKSSGRSARHCRQWTRATCVCTSRKQRARSASLQAAATRCS